MSDLPHNRWLNPDSLWILFRLNGSEVIKRKWVRLPEKESKGYRPRFFADATPRKNVVIWWVGDDEGEAKVELVDLHIQRWATEARLVSGDWRDDANAEYELRLTPKGRRIIEYGPEIREFRALVDHAYPLLTQPAERVETCFALTVEALVQHMIEGQPLDFFELLLEYGGLRERKRRA